MNHIETISVQCPYCGESIELVVDCSMQQQSYIEDCEVCCRPINVNVQINSNGFAEVTVKNENEA